MAGRPDGKYSVDKFANFETFHPGRSNKSLKKKTGIV